MKSGRYTFVDGHLYYDNNVIKIRYDLILSDNNQMFKENELFDYYFNIFIIDKNQKMLEDTPLDSIKSHRFGYIMMDQNNETPQTLIILPYLHDHKIYLNRIKINTDYFYTSIETKLGDEEEYHDNILKKL